MAEEDKSSLQPDIEQVSETDAAQKLEEDIASLDIHKAEEAEDTKVDVEDTTALPTETEAAASTEDKSASQDVGEAEVAGEDSHDQLDDDEIEENPAYIPKKGKYYMHDSRDDGDFDENEGKKSRADGAWKHDRFDERSQRPKSKKQLLTRYGFDIRVNEGEEDVEEAISAKDADPPKEPDETKSKPKNKKPNAKPRPPARPATAGSDKTDRNSAADELNASANNGTRSPVTSKGNHQIDRDSNQKNRDRYAENAEDEEERAAERRNQRPPQAKVVRNVRGGRGSGHVTSAPVRSDRDRWQRDRFDSQPQTRDHDYQDRRPGNYQRSERVDYADRGEERHFENHRRGATRGAVRGGGAPAFSTAPRQYTRTFSSSRYERPPSNGGGIEGNRGSGYNERIENGNYQPNNSNHRGGPMRGRSDFYDSRPRGGFSARGVTPRGDFAPPRGMTRASGSSQYSSRGAPPKRYSSQRQDGPPPPNPTRREFVGPRQPTDVVYFDPSQQINRMPPAPREKKIIEIVPPTA